MNPSRIATALVLALAVLHGLVLALPGPALLDFGSFLASGQAAGRGMDPYGIYEMTFHVVLPGFESWNPNLNPPPSLPLFQALSGLEPAFAFRLWWAVSLACYGVALWLLARRYGRPLMVLWALALAGFWDSLVLGQIYLPLVLAAVLAWLALERGAWVRAGIALGILVAVKPNFAVWPALLLLAGHARPVVVAAASAAVLALLPVLLYGPAVYGQWLDLVLKDAHRAHFLTNASLSGLALRLGLPGLGMAASLALLASPIAWVHYTLFLLPPFFALAPSRLLRASAALLVVPVPLVLTLLAAPRWLQASAGSAYGWAMVLCLAALLSPSRQATSEGDVPRTEEVR